MSIAISTDTCDELQWRKLREHDLALAERFMIGLGIRKSRRNNILNSLASYEMTIKGYDFILSIISHSIKDNTTDFYWMDEGFTLYLREDTFAWSDFATRTQSGGRIRYVNNLMPDRHNIKHADIHQFCKTMENFLFVLEKISGHSPYQAGSKKRPTLAESIRYVEQFLNHNEKDILSHFRNFRNFISHSPDQIEDCLYRGVALSTCHRRKIKFDGRTFSFLDDMAVITKKLINIFRKKQATQIDKAKFLKRIQMIEKFTMFDGKYRLAMKRDTSERTPPRTSESDQDEVIIRADYSINHVGFWISDGRFISLPKRWYPRLMEANSDDLSNWHVTEDGMAISWPALQQEIRLTDIVAGRAAPGVVK
ncbi:DUF2442 domain-containing protein [Bosea sp. R86505]|uniref:DUF2442 domain-containing protein n=1 Tax=Bosea sp. R86505 TaxID=3101710 RepID=UPI00366EB58A